MKNVREAEKAALRLRWLNEVSRFHFLIHAVSTLQHR